LAVGAKAAPDERHMNVLRYSDVVVVLVAAIPALILGAPALGYILGGGVWIIARLLEANDGHLLRRFDDPVQRLGAKLFAAFGRIWLLAGAIVIAAVVGGRKDGLTATLVIFGAYTVAFVARLMSGPPPSREGR
jgi:hypothetical protein